MGSNSFVSATFDENNEIELWDGIFVDVFMELSIMLNFSYKVTTPSDKEFGIIKSDGSWSGMVGQLATKEADVGNICPGCHIVI